MACVFLQKKHDISHDRKMKLIVDIIFSIQGMNAKKASIPFFFLFAHQTRFYSWLNGRSF